MELSHLLQEFGRHCGIPLSLEQNHCTLRFDDAHEVTLEQDGATLLLYGVVHTGEGLAGRADAAETLRLLLTASCLGAQTDGGALSLWESTGEVVLWKRFDAFADALALENAVNAFLAQLVHWKERLASSGRNVKETQTTIPDPRWVDMRG